MTKNLWNRIEICIHDPMLGHVLEVGPSIYLNTRQPELDSLRVIEFLHNNPRLVYHVEHNEIWNPLFIDRRGTYFSDILPDFGLCSTSIDPHRRGYLTNSEMAISVVPLLPLAPTLGKVCTFPYMEEKYNGLNHNVILSIQSR
jgi:hypothetical protein